MPTAHTNPQALHASDTSCCPESHTQHHLLSTHTHTHTHTCTPPQFLHLSLPFSVPHYFPLCISACPSLGPCQHHHTTPPREPCALSSWQSPPAWPVAPKHTHGEGALRGGGTSTGKAPPGMVAWWCGLCCPQDPISLWQQATCTAHALLPPPSIIQAQPHIKQSYLVGSNQQHHGRHHRLPCHSSCTTLPSCPRQHPSATWQALLGSLAPTHAAPLSNRAKLQGNHKPNKGPQPMVAPHRAGTLQRR